MARRNPTKARALSPKSKKRIEECIIELALVEGLNTDGGAKHRLADEVSRFSALPDYNVRVAVCAEILDKMIKDGHLMERDGKYRPAEQKTSVPMSGRNMVGSRTSAVRPNPGARVAPAPPAYG
ncbi:MAG: hypothetical protein AAB395_02175 [Patescibacteria group bacterium]